MSVTVGSDVYCYAPKWLSTANYLRSHDRCLGAMVSVCSQTQECEVRCMADRFRADFHEAPALLGKLKRMGGGGRQRTSAYVDPRDIEGCEALLEAHFTQVLVAYVHPLMSCLLDLQNAVSVVGLSMGNAYPFSLSRLLLVTVHDVGLIILNRLSQLQWSKSCLE